MFLSDLFAGQALPYHVVALVFGYLCGSIPFGVLISRVFQLGDLRQIGSGNIGATNVLRTGNKLAAFLTLLMDGLKGTLPVLIAWQWGPVTAGLAGIGAILGHCLPVWLRFQGGKGVATFLGVLFGYAWEAGAIACVIWLLVAAIGRRSSLAALVAAASSPILLFVLSEHGFILLAALMATFIWWRHLANIRRLLAGTEPRIGQK